MSFRNPMRRLAALITGVTFVVGAIATLMLLQALELQFFPVKDMKTVDMVEVRGADLWVAGSFRKIRNCEYIGPVRVVAGTGRNLYVVSHSPVAKLNWQSGQAAQRFGPWQIVNGAGHKVKLYQEYACHDLWRQFDDVAVIDTRITPYKIEVAK